MKKRKSDKAKLTALLKWWGVPFDHFTDPQFLSEIAMSQGAVESIGVRSTVDFYFDKNGRIVGTTTHCRNSFYPRRTGQGRKGMR